MIKNLEVLPLRGKRIFIVEDNITNMAVYAVTLQRSGAVVIQDFWNSRTINLLKDNLPVDIILLDLMLHNNLSGYDIFDELKGFHDFDGIPILAVSASDPEIEIPKTMKKGFDGFIGKPISLFEFPRQVAACIKGNKIWAAD